MKLVSLQSRTKIIFYVSAVAYPFGLVITLHYWSNEQAHTGSLVFKFFVALAQQMPQLDLRTPTLYEMGSFN